MFKHTWHQETGSDEATIKISGEAVFTQAQEMESALGEALEACRHLIIDIGGIEAFDSTFEVLLCSLHRRSDLGNKRISIQGSLPRQESLQTRQAKANGCLLQGTNKRCPLWEPVCRNKR